MMWNPRMETMPRADLHALQLRRVQAAVWRAAWPLDLFRRPVPTISPRRNGKGGASCLSALGVWHVASGRNSPCPFNRDRSWPG